MGVSYSKVRSTMVKYSIPRRDNIDLSLNKPLIKPTKALCYILGVLKGDGYCYKNQSNHYIVLENTAMPFILSFKESLHKIGLDASKVYSRKRNYNHNEIHKTMVGSKIFFNWYKHLGIKDIIAIISQSKGELDFIRGVYESEGSFFLAGGKRPTLTIASTDRKLMLLTKKLVESMDLSPTFPKPQKLRSGKPYYKLYFNKQKEIKIFIDRVKPCIKRTPIYNKGSLQ